MMCPSLFNPEYVLKDVVSDVSKFIQSCICTQGCCESCMKVYSMTRIMFYFYFQCERGLWTSRGAGTADRPPCSRRHLLRVL